MPRIEAQVRCCAPVLAPHTLVLDADGEDPDDEDE
jgi:hypothetical protein